MGEALIWYRKRGIDEAKPETITNNGNYVVPVTGNYTVYCVGGGGGGGGGCRNAWNTSQTFYGTAGSRGAMKSTTLSLNQGDQIPITIGAAGAGGTNNTSPLVWSNGQTQSQGTNGASGGTTTFGSHLSAAGGTYGQWAYSARIWTNTQNWSNGWRWNNKRSVSYNNRFAGSPPSGALWETTDHYIGWSQANWTSLWSQYGMLYWENRYTGSWTNKAYNYQTYPLQQISDSQASAINQQLLTGSQYPIVSYELRWYKWTTPPYQGVSGAGNAYTYWNNYTIYKWNNTYDPYNTFLGWWNRYTNYSTRCYTTSQTGSWWYTNNNVVTTSGQRAYRGDGGNSGRPGNAGFVLIVPKSSGT